MDPEHADEKRCITDVCGGEALLFWFGSINGVLIFEIPPWRFFEIIPGIAYGNGVQKGIGFSGIASISASASA